MLDHLRRLRKSSVRAARVSAHNLGLLPANFYVLPFGRSRWLVRHKRTPGANSGWSTIQLRPGTADLSTFVHVFIREDYAVDRLGREGEILGEYQRILAAGKRPLIVDCGSNIGLASLYFSLSFPDASVFGIEPSRENLAQAAGHCTGQIYQHLGAVSDRDEVLTISNPSAAADAFRVQKSGATSAACIPALSMDSIVTMARGRDPDAVPFIAKIDIEGFEETLFSSGTDWIDQFKVIAIELHDWMLPGRATSRTFLQAVSQRSRDFLYRGDIAFSVRHD